MLSGQKWDQLASAALGLPNSGVTTGEPTSQMSEFAMSGGQRDSLDYLSENCKNKSISDDGPVWPKCKNLNPLPRNESGIAFNLKGRASAMQQTLKLIELLSDRHLKQTSQGRVESSSSQQTENPRLALRSNGIFLNNCNQDMTNLLQRSSPDLIPFTEQKTTDGASSKKKLRQDDVEAFQKAYRYQLNPSSPPEPVNDDSSWLKSNADSLQVCYLGSDLEGAMMEDDSHLQINTVSVESVQAEDMPVEGIDLLDFLLAGSHSDFSTCTDNVNERASIVNTQEMASKHSSFERSNSCLNLPCIPPQPYADNTMPSSQGYIQERSLSSLIQAAMSALQGGGDNRKLLDSILQEDKDLKILEDVPKNRKRETSVEELDFSCGNTAAPGDHLQDKGKVNASRYESQKRRDWNTFGQYLQNHRPPIQMSKCTSQHVVEFLQYLDQFGKTKVHNSVCHFYGSNGTHPCGCPMRQAWGSLDSLVGRLRAAYEENGGSAEMNPFGARVVRLYLRETRDSQAKARGIAYEKKKRKRHLQQSPLPPQLRKAN